MKTILLLLLMITPLVIYAEAPVTVTASPNPFKGSTTFTFTQEKPTPVQVDIYDIRGRLVITLVPESGYGIVWNGTNSAGQMVSSGVYVYRLTTGQYTIVNRLLFLR